MLDAPLGDRVVIDTLTGEEVPVQNEYGLERGRLYLALRRSPAFRVERGSVRETTATAGVSDTGCLTLDGDLALAPRQSRILDNTRIEVVGIGTWTLGDRETITAGRTVVRRTEESSDAVKRCLIDVRTSEAVVVRGLRPAR